MSNKRVTKITAALNSMGKDDIYSFMLFALYKMKDIPDYLALSELAYILDNDNLTRFLSYYGGMTITIPTMHDLRAMINGLRLYQFVNVEGGDFDEGLRLLVKDEFSADDIRNIYKEVSEVISKYDFKREDNTHA